MSVHMKNYVYEVLERKENDIVVGDGSISFELLKRDGKRLDGAPAIAGRRVGCFYWNYDRSTAKLGGYTMQAFYPDMYEYNGRIYFVYGEVENLGGKYPLNRFLWEDEAEPKSEQELHRIIRRQSPWSRIYDDIERKASGSSLKQQIILMLRAGADIAECREYWIKNGEEERDFWVFLDTLDQQERDYCVKGKRREPKMIKWQSGEMDITLLTECTNAVNGNIPKAHEDNVFWCPKDKDGRPDRPGLYLYAYGGCVLKLYLIKPDRKEKWELHFSLFDTGYETKYFVDKDGNSTWTRETRKKYDDAKNISGGSKARLERLLTLNERDWDIILNAFKTRAYAGIDGKRYLERARETVIAHNNNGEHKDSLKIIEMESRIREIKSGKKPDMIGVRSEGEDCVLSFIEYKCTSGAMIGVSRPVKHYDDMKNYFSKKDMFDYYESYDKRLGKPVLKKAADAEREILFLFSHVGIEDTRSGMSIQTALNGIYEVKGQAEADGLTDKVKAVILKDESGIIRREDIKSLDDAITQLKSMESKELS